MRTDVTAAKLGPSPSNRSPGIRLAGVLLLAVVLAAVGLWTILPHNHRPIIQASPGTSAAEASSSDSDMVLLPGGTFRMGDDFATPADQRPAHDVSLPPLWFDRHEVTNRQFAAFVRAAGYLTTAETQDWASVFDRQKKSWVKRPGANWRHPSGPDSRIDGRDNFPVVQVSWYDAQAYAQWAGKRLPSEAEWEYAARAGIRGAAYPWGPQETIAGRYQGNYWQGWFPDKDLALDGFDGLAPVASFSPNRFGLYDMAGNAWEWCRDYYAADYYRSSPDAAPPGPEQGTDRVVRGGSWLSADSDGAAFRVAARGKRPPGSCSQDVGFRCVRNATLSER